MRVLVRGLALAGETASQRGQRLRAGQAGIQLAGSPGRAERALRAACGVALAAQRCAHGLLWLLCGTSDKGRLCHVAPPPDRAAGVPASPHTVHAAYARGQVFYAPTDVILTDHDVVQPDLVVVTTPEQISERGIEGPPTLLIEILSPSSADYDRTVKAQHYAALGVPHYWIVDPEARTVECYRLVRARFVLRASGRDQESLTVPDFPDLTIPLGTLWP